jgi:hypothetical protein
VIDFNHRTKAEDGDSMKTISTLVLALMMALTITGCTSNMFGKGAGGAAAGAFSASFIGAATDLILDGKINPDRLARNAVGGAIGGGMAGAAVGHQQDVQASQKAAQATAKQQGLELQKTIGKDNYNALIALVNKQHADAYRDTMAATDSKHRDVKAAAYAIQALIDLDRGNADGVSEALTAFIAIDDEVNDLPAARQGLNQLHKQLQQERKVQGIR